MSQVGEGEILFRHKSSNVTSVLYALPLPWIGVALLYFSSDRTYLHHNLSLGLPLIAVQTIFLLMMYAYMRSYKILAGRTGLIVNSLFGSKELAYIRLRKVTLRQVGIGQKSYRLEVINDQGSVAIKIMGDKSLVENIADTLNTRISPFGLAPPDGHVCGSR
jgi:hypothetical protein